MFAKGPLASRSSLKITTQKNIIKIVLYVDLHHNPIKV
jgi:hypothetical protein